MGIIWTVLVDWPAGLIGTLMKAGWAIVALVGAAWVAFKAFELTGAAERSIELRMPVWKVRVIAFLAFLLFVWLALVLYRAEYFYAIETLNPRDEYYY